MCNDDCVNAYFEISLRDISLVRNYDPIRQAFVVHLKKKSSDCISTCTTTVVSTGSRKPKVVEIRQKLSFLTTLNSINNDNDDESQQGTLIVENVTNQSKAYTFGSSNLRWNRLLNTKQSHIIKILNDQKVLVGLLYATIIGNIVEDECIKIQDSSNIFMDDKLDKTDDCNEINLKECTKLGSVGFNEVTERFFIPESRINECMDDTSMNTTNEVLSISMITTANNDLNPVDFTEKDMIPLETKVDLTPISTELSAKSMTDLNCRGNLDGDNGRRTALTEQVESGINLSDSQLLPNNTFNIDCNTILPDKTSNIYADMNGVTSSNDNNNVPFISKNGGVENEESLIDLQAIILGLNRVSDIATKALTPTKNKSSLKNRTTNTSNLKEKDTVDIDSINRPLQSTSTSGLGKGQTIYSSEQIINKRLTILSDEYPIINKVDKSININISIRNESRSRERILTFSRGDDESENDDTEISNDASKKKTNKFTPIKASQTKFDRKKNDSFLNQNEYDKLISQNNKLKNAIKCMRAKMENTFANHKFQCNLDESIDSESMSRDDDFDLNTTLVRLQLSNEESILSPIFSIASPSYDNLTLHSFDTTSSLPSSSTTTNLKYKIHPQKHKIIDDNMNDGINDNINNDNIDGSCINDSSTINSINDCLEMQKVDFIPDATNSGDDCLITYLY